MSSFKNISIKNKPISDYIVEDFFEPTAWCYQKYNSGLIHIYRSSTTLETANCDSTYGNVYYDTKLRSYKMSFPNINITQICSWVSSISSKGSNGLYWIFDRNIEIIDNNGVKGIRWDWYIISAIKIQVDIYASASCWARYEPIET